MDVIRKKRRKTIENELRTVTAGTYKRSPKKNITLPPPHISTRVSLAFYGII